ncbi:hypothetical protein ACIRQP_20120 [Streptomyces sp. NPDC102274]|uniref:hypothetical protein n=1 Tax=Streptomyces sp. NPDC102274 TaxID=3366151 RepID=UPI0037FC9E78
MSNWISVVVILGLIVVGVMVINLINGQHRNRIATYSFGRSLWQPPKAPRNHSAGPTASAVADTDVETGQGGVRTVGGHGLHRLSGLISARVRRRRKAAR